MRKEKEKKVIEFNPADYDYLDDASIEEYLSQILTRNHSFIIEVDKMNLASKEDSLQGQKLRNSIFKKYKIFPTLKYSKSKPKLKVRLSYPVTAFRIFPSDDPEYINNPENPHSLGKYWDDAVTIDNEIADATYYCDENHPHFLNELFESLFRHQRDGKNYITRDTLLIAIDLNSSIETIEKKIKKILSIHKKRKKVVLDLINGSTILWFTT